MKIGRPKIKIPTKKELSIDILTMTDEQTASKYGISRMTLTKWKKEKGLFKSRC